MTSPANRRKRILVFAEAVTLAHVARPLRFAVGLDQCRYQIAIAAADRVASHIAASGIERIGIGSIEPSRFLLALARGRAVYDADTLERYVHADLAAIERFEPDLVVGDFRLSLSVSARLAQVPYVAISNAYWSPYYKPLRWPVPSLPLTRLLPIGMAQVVFELARPRAFALHCGPLNRVRSRNGLTPLPRDLRAVYTDADHVAYADLPALFPTADMPREHRFVGAPLWEPCVKLPAWWGNVPLDRPIVYVTLGSSGEHSLLPSVVACLASLPVTVLLSSAGFSLPATLPPNVLAASYLPGLEAAKLASLVVCNGGNLTAYQALAGGAPVIGIASNLDQFLNMDGFERAGVGRTVRADRFSAARLRSEAVALLGDDAFRTRVLLRGQQLTTMVFEKNMAQLVEELIG